MKKILAKMQCDVITETSVGKTATLNAVVRDSEENKTFSEYTPSATMSILVTKNAPAGDFFVVGEEYVLEFTKVE